MLEQPVRFKIYNRQLFFTYHMNYYEWYNDYFNEDWHGNDESFVGIGIAQKWHWFERYSTNYDGHYLATMNILGIVFSRGHTWESEPKYK